MPVGATALIEQRCNKTYETANLNASNNSAAEPLNPRNKALVFSNRR